jgi:hypothetical protein
MRVQFILVLAAASYLAGCSRSGGDPATKRRVADKDVNTRHLQGTTEVLKNFRYGQRPKASQAAVEPKTRKPQEKPK